MPEGDTLAWHANRIRPVLEGRAADRVRPHRRFAADRLVERMQGVVVERVSAVGKHLMLSLENELVLHSHLGMVGTWGVYPPGRRWRRPARRAWLVLCVGETEIVQFDGPTLELLTQSRLRQVLARLGPDILGAKLDLSEVLRRLRLDDPARPIGDTLLDQRVIAGIGNMWKAEGCWEAQVDPWRPMSSVTDEEIVRVIELTRPRMLHSASQGMNERDNQVYGRGGQPCRRCGTRIASRGQWEDNRLTYWCPGCQH